MAKNWRSPKGQVHLQLFSKTRLRFWSQGRFAYWAVTLQTAVMNQCKNLSVHCTEVLTRKQALSTHYIYLLVDVSFLKSIKDTHDCIGFIFQKPKPCLLWLDQSYMYAALPKLSHLRHGVCLCSSFLGFTSMYTFVACNIFNIVGRWK